MGRKKNKKPQKQHRKKIKRKQPRQQRRQSASIFPSHVGQEVRTALRYQQTGKLEQAQTIYRRILKTYPKHPDALHLLGVIADQSGNKDKAIALITKAIKNSPTNPFYYNNLGSTLLDVGKVAKALYCFEKAVGLQPDFPEAHNSLGNAFLHEGNAAQAIKCFQQAVSLKPDYFEAYNNLGNAFLSQGNAPEAISNYEKAKEIRPDSADAYNNLGNVLLAEGKTEEAVACCQKALDLRPDFAEAHNNLGNAFERLGRMKDALGSYEKAVELRPDLAQAFNNMGVIYENQGRTDPAVASFRHAITLKPDYAEAYRNLGNLFRTGGKPDEAIACYIRAVDIAWNDVEAHNNLGNLFLAQDRLEEAIASFQTALNIEPLQAETTNNLGVALADQGRLEEAIACHHKAVALKPDLGSAYDNLFRELQRTCSWEGLHEVAARLDDITKKALDHGKKPAETPFLSITRHEDPMKHFLIAKAHSEAISVRSFDPAASALSRSRKSSEDRITVGYLSSDFRNHPVAHLMVSLFGLHDRNHFKIFCYSYGSDDKSFYRKKIHRDCDKFVDVRPLGHMDAAKCILEDQVDILVDLNGHTRGNRLEICASRPAPVQISYMFPGTTGADFIDYILTDAIVTPENQAFCFSERFILLPHCYMVNDHTQAISPKTWTKEELGLPEAHFVFSSFNQSYKVEPITFDSWMKILQQVPNGVLWLLRDNAVSEANLRREAEARGIAGERLIFAEKLPKEEHLARLRCADLTLDTKPYNGHTTTSDSLWAGVPVITLQGTHFASRVSSSMLNAVGLPELVTHSFEEYEALAVRLSHDSFKLQAIRQRLAENRSTYPLFDTPQFVKNLEHAYTKIWEIFLAGNKPIHIAVDGQ